MKEFLMTTYTIALPIVLTSFMGYISFTLKQQKKSRDANSEGTKCLLRVKLIEYHDRYISEESIPSYALSNWIEMYNAYEGLGGNGMIKGMNDEVHRLPIK